MCLNLVTANLFIHKPVAFAQMFHPHLPFKLFKALKLFSKIITKIRSTLYNLLFQYLFDPF